MVKAITKTDLTLGNSDVPISLYSAVESQTRFKQVSKCCGDRVRYRKFCGSCEKELSNEDIKKAIEVGDKMKEVDTEKIKQENGSLKVLGVLDSESEEEGVFKDGKVWFIGIQEGKKKDKTERNITKFQYLREALEKSGKNLLCLISMRGKENIVLLKPYFNNFVGLGLYFFDRIRDVKDIKTGSIETDKKVVEQMSEQIKGKESVKISGIDNKREKLIEKSLMGEEVKAEGEKPQEELNVKELVSF